MRLHAITAALCAPVLLSAQQRESVRYDVAFPNAVHHEASITAEFRGVPAGTLVVQMSRSSPGRYALHEFAKNVYGVEAADSAGRPLRIARTTPHEWRVATRGGTVRVVEVATARALPDTIDRVLYFNSWRPDSQAFTLTRLRALPPGAPAGFENAVGEFHVSWGLDRGHTAQDQAVLLRLDVDTRAAQRRRAPIDGYQWPHGGRFSSAKSSAPRGVPVRHEIVGNGLLLRG